MKIHPVTRHHRGRILAASTLAATLALTAACGGGASSPPQPAGSSGTSTNAAVLPVDKDPITNTSSVEALVIDSVLVENNVDSSGAATDDHVEVALSNTGAKDLADFEVFYTFTDPTTGDTESYYAALPASFSIPAGGHRTAHFDNTSVADHFAVNQYSLYYTDKNALEVTVKVSAPDAAPKTAKVGKDAGGSEEAD